MVTIRCENTCIDPKLYQNSLQPLYDLIIDHDLKMSRNGNNNNSKYVAEATHALRQNVWDWGNAHFIKWSWVGIFKFFVIKLLAAPIGIFGEYTVLKNVL